MWQQSGQIQMQAKMVGGMMRGTSNVYKPEEFEGDDTSINKNGKLVE